MDDEEEALRAADRLIAYWRTHPRAADTIEGIQRWWFDDLPVSRSVVRVALRRLMREGRVTATTAADGRVRFRWVDVSNGSPANGEEDQT